MSSSTTDTDAKIIDAVGIDDLEKAVTDREPDASSQRLFQEEQVYLRARRAKIDHDEDQIDAKHLVGLALSGGGIRSATFSLGVMQALANKDLMKKVDYLSTVSGGGYIGSSLSWLVSDKAEREYRKEHPEDKTLYPGMDRDHFPFGADDPDPELGSTDAQPSAAAEPKPGERDWRHRILRFLRHHGYYLTPGAGINLLSLLGVVLRGGVLNLLVWIPLLVLLFLFGSWGFGLLDIDPPIMKPVFEAFQPDAPCVATAKDIVTVVSADTVCAGSQTKEILDDLIQTRLPQLFGFELLLDIAVVMLVLLLLGTIFYSLMTWRRYAMKREQREKWYERRRRAEQSSSLMLSVFIVLLVVGSVPIVAIYLHSWLAASGPVAMITGMGLAIRHFIASAKSDGGKPPGILVSIGAGLFLYGAVVVAFQLAFLVIPSLSALWGSVVVVSLIAVPILTGWFVNLNHISIHRYYRDRLMETFMPDLATALADGTDKAVGANEAKLQEFAVVDDPRGPYHIVNTNVVLVDSKEDTYKNRGGDNFILSSLYCGSNATGWCPTKRFMGGRMTLATAMAISGAAANPNTGVGGEGLTRDRVLSLLMALLNLRLGYWAANPSRCTHHLPNHFIPGLYAFSSAIGLKRGGLNEHRDFLELTDGGHFENMAVYELVRRRLGLIIVCDGGADKEFSFSDFQTTIRRIEDDFGAKVMMYQEANPDNLVPKKPDNPLYPTKACFSDQGHMVGRITYSDGSKGFLIFLKTTLIEGVSFKVKGYAAQNPDFPDQTTADQFFDEVQFEAYRALGFRLAEKMLRKEVPEQSVEDLKQAYGIKPDKEKPTTNEDLIRYCYGG